jgi:hypothetical protein
VVVVVLLGGGGGEVKVHHVAPLLRLHLPADNSTSNVTIQLHSFQMRRNNGGILFTVEVVRNSK